MPFSISWSCRTTNYFNKVEGHRTTFTKQERLVSRKLIERLFSEPASHSLVAFPLRMVCLLRERLDGDAPVQVLISVPKRHLRHAVDRNRVKRQIREAYRLRKQVLYSQLPADKALMLAFLWLSDKPVPTAVVAAKIDSLMNRLVTKL